MLGVEHGPLEVVRLAEHPQDRDAGLRRGQDLQVAEAEHPPEDRLGEDRVVDLLERRVDHPLVDHAFHAEDPAARDDVFLVPPAERLPEDVEQAADNEGENDEAQDVATCALPEVAAQEEQHNRGDDRQEPVEGVGE